MAKIDRIVVEYVFDAQGYPSVISSLIENDFDMLDMLLSGDLDADFSLDIFERDTMIGHKTWWKNATKIEFDSGYFEISLAFDVDASVRISAGVLQKVLYDWRKFLMCKTTFKSIYLCDQ